MTKIWILWGTWQKQVQGNKRNQVIKESYSVSGKKMWYKGVSDHFQNLCGLHQHLIKRVCIISPLCSFKSGDLVVFPGLFCSVPCKLWSKPLKRITVFCQQIASLLNRIRSLLTHKCSVLSLWWFKAQSHGYESRTSSGNASMGKVTGVFSFFTQESH